MILPATAGALIVAGLLGLAAELAGVQIVPRRARRNVVARASWWQRATPRTRRLIVAAAVVLHTAMTALGVEVLTGAKALGPT